MRIILLAFVLLSFSTFADDPTPESQVDLSTCRWETNIPRKIVSAPSKCNPRQKVKACTGYASCLMPAVGNARAEQKVAAVYCKEEFCSDNKLMDCLQDESVSSESVSGTEGDVVSKRVEDAIFFRNQR